MISDFLYSSKIKKSWFRSCSILGTLLLLCVLLLVALTGPLGGLVKLVLVENVPKVGERLLSYLPEANAPSLITGTSGTLKGRASRELSLGLYFPCMQFK